MPSFVAGMSFYVTTRQDAHQVLVQQSRHGKHLASALAVRAGDDRRMDVLEPTLLEEEVGREGA